MIRLPGGVEERIRREAAGAYPEECCGVLLGRDGTNGSASGERRILDLRAVPNALREGRERRYLIDPATLRTIEEQARSRRAEVVGFYHSHPDHPAEPSKLDREQAWPWYSYIIVPVREGSAGAPRSWRLLDDRSGFREEPITMENQE